MVVGDKIRTGHSVLDRQRVKHRVSFKTSLLLNSPLRQISYVNQPENEADEDEASDSKKKKGDNPVSATTFNNITLSLPRVALVLTHSSLGLETLLQMYVSREPVSQSSTEKSPIILKQLTFGRLPQCLCLHVQVRKGYYSLRTDGGTCVFS